MQHTYLRYECADSFGLVSSAGTTNATKTLGFLPNNNTLNSSSSILVSTANSQLVGFSLRSDQSPCLKIGHRELLSGGVGTRLALNSHEVICLDIANGNHDSNIEKNTVVKVATGWMDGTVRIFELFASELTESNSSNLGCVHSLIQGSSKTNEDFLTREPLVLKGHTNSPVRSICFDRIANSSTVSGDALVSRLASGGSDGVVIIWDIVAETGLFRLLGHRGPITDLHFCSPSASSLPYTKTSQNFDGLVSSSQDGLVKVWDLAAQCCTQTLAGHKGAVLCSAMASVDGQTKGTRWRCITGCSDGQARVWSIMGPKRLAFNQDKQESIDTEEMTNSSSQDVDVAKSNVNMNDDDVFSFMGVLSPPPNVAASNEKITSIQFQYPSGKFVGVLRANSKNIDLYKVRNKADSLRKMQRRLRRKREKVGKKFTAAATEDEGGKKKGKKRGILEDDDDDDENNKDQNDSEMIKDDLSHDINQTKASDEFQYIGTARASHKVKSFTFAPYREKGGGIRIVCALATNSLEVHSVTKNTAVDTIAQNDETDSYIISKLSSLDMYGHPTGIRSIAISSNDVLACTVSKSMTKIWNVATRSCVRSLPLTTNLLQSSKSKISTFYGLCTAFFPGDSHVIVGTREGHLLIIDIASGDTVYIEENAHEGAIWSLDIKRPTAGETGVSIVTGSADKSVKFWDVERQDEDDEEVIAAGHPMVVHMRTLKTADDVVAVRFSHSLDPTKRMVFVSTLDCQIKVFFDDTLKFFLSLYGHSLPALALDASDDDTILASGGADKTIKIWGLDFGDTHKTLYGHTDSITDLRFVRRTHNFFTSSKDGSVRFWDGDRFEQILSLNGHTAELNCLAVSRTGAFVLSGGMDRQVRVWERTQDIVFIEEEKERALEALFDGADGNRNADKGTASIMRAEGDEEHDDEAENEPQSEAAVRRSVLSVSSGDRIMEAIEKSDQELKDLATFNKSQKGKGEKAKQRMLNPLLLGMEPHQYILWVLRSVKSAELEQSLLVIPLSHIERLLYYLIVLIRSGRGVELCSRVSVFLIKIHQNQIISNKTLASPLRELKRLIKLRLEEIRDTVGYNIAAMKAVSRIANDKKNQYLDHDSDKNGEDVWAGLGLGSDIAAALQNKKGERNQ